MSENVIKQSKYICAWCWEKYHKESLAEECYQKQFGAFSKIHPYALGAKRLCRINMGSDDIYRICKIVSKKGDKWNLEYLIETENDERYWASWYDCVILNNNSDESYGAWIEQYHQIEKDGKF